MNSETLLQDLDTENLLIKHELKDICWNISSDHLNLSDLMRSLRFIEREADKMVRLVSDYSAMEHYEESDTMGAKDLACRLRKEAEE